MRHAIGLGDAGERGFEGTAEDILFEVVAGFAVLAEVQAVELVLFADAQATDGVGELEQDEGGDHAEGDGDACAAELIGELHRIAIHPAGLAAVDRADREDAGQGVPSTPLTPWTPKASSESS